MVLIRGVIGLLIIGLWLYCILDVITTDSSRIRNMPKILWLGVVIILPTIGSIMWLVAGRPYRDTPGSRAATAPAAPSWPGRPLNPDDDEEFLKKLRERAEEQRRAARESNEARERQERRERDSTAGGETRNKPDDHGGTQNEREKADENPEE